MTKHALYSPSSAHRWLQCPASVRYNSTGTTNKAAAIGTLLHLVTEQELNNLTTSEALTPKYRKLVTKAIEQFKSLEASLISTETTLKYNDQLFGTTDFLAEKDGSLVVGDFKFGQGKVSPEDNPQLLIYAYMALELYPQYKDVSLVIIQPTINKEPQIHQTTAKEIQKWFDNNVKEVFNKDYYSLGKHCKYCPALDLPCPAYEGLL